MTIPDISKNPSSEELTGFVNEASSYIEKEVKNKLDIKEVNVIRVHEYDCTCIYSKKNYKGLGYEVKNKKVILFDKYTSNNDHHTVKSGDFAESPEKYINNVIEGLTEAIYEDYTRGDKVVQLSFNFWMMKEDGWMEFLAWADLAFDAEEEHQNEV